jgi:hypothetical protein
VSTRQASGLGYWTFAPLAHLLTPTPGKTWMRSGKIAETLWRQKTTSWPWLSPEKILSGTRKKKP